jgi:hypothetical protein
MNKSWLVIILTISLIILCSCSGIVPSQSLSTPTTATRVPISPETLAPTPFAPTGPFRTPPMFIPEGVRPLADAEKDRLIDIAVKTNQAHQRGTADNTTIGWAAIRWINQAITEWGTYVSFPYNIVQTGVPQPGFTLTSPGVTPAIVSGEVPQGAVFYPEVRLYYRQQTSPWTVSVDIDLNTWQTVLVQSNMVRQPIPITVPSPSLPVK